MIFFFKSDGTLIKSAPETVYQGSAEAGKVYVVAPLNANMLVDVYYELPNGDRWGAYLLENNGTVINNEELPDGWALWSTTLESAITQYAGTLKAQFGFYQSGTADKVPLITSQGVTITIAKGVVRDLPSVPTADIYAQIVNAISSIKQDIANLPNEYLSNTNEDKIALKNNGAIEYSENATAGTIVKRDSNGKINVADGTEDLNAVNLGQFNAALAGKVDASSVSSASVKDTIAQRTATGQLKAADGVADDDLATVKQLNAVQGNYTDITNIDLNTGDKTVEYDTELGITVNAKGTVTHKNGSTEQPTTKFEVPIIAGAGVSIDKKENEEKIEIKSLNSNLENGTGTGSLVQKRLKSDGATWTTAKAYQGASTALGGGTQAGRTEEDFNAYFWDSATNRPLHGGSKNSSGEILDNHGLTYKESYSFSVAEGEQTKAFGRGSHSEGYYTETKEEYSHAEGWQTVSVGLASHSEGSQTTSIGKYSHAEGFGTNAIGDDSHSEGMSTEARGHASHVEGFATRALEDYQHVEGVYNADNSNALHIVGNGTSENARKNAFVVLKDGRAKVQTAPKDNDDVVRKGDLANIGGGKLFRHEISVTVEENSYLYFYFTDNVQNYSTFTDIPIKNGVGYYESNKKATCPAAFKIDVSSNMLGIYITTMDITNPSAGVQYTDIYKDFSLIHYTDTAIQL